MKRTKRDFEDDNLELENVYNEETDELYASSCMSCIWYS